MRAKAYCGLMLGLLGAGCDDGGPNRGVNTQGATYAGPQFPGAGTSGSANGIAAGQIALGCEAPVPFDAVAKPGAQATINCLYGDDPSTPAATVEWILESSVSADLVHVRLTFNPDFVDNSYGATAIGWSKGDTDPLAPVDPLDPTAPAGPGKGQGKMPGGPGKKPGGPGGPGGRGHTFKDLVGSDHAEFKLSDASGALRMQFKADYISEVASAPSGYASLGAQGGDGKMISGNASDIIAVTTSLERNLNACGFGDYLTDSPETDALYTVNPAAANWDYRVVYDVWVRASAFGSAGFGQATVNSVHASPSKLESNTVEVTPRECPPGWPPYCQNVEYCGPDPVRDEPGPIGY